MAIVSIMPAGSLGLIKDLNPAELPPNAWSDGQNARFLNGTVEPFKESQLLGTTTGFQGVWAYPTVDPATGLAVWLVMGASKAKCFTDNVLTDVTRSAGDYTGQESDRWSGGALSGVLVANNGVDVPQAWLTPGGSNLLVNLANWPATARAKALRSFKQFLIALDITKGSTRYPTLVKWSHPADPGTVPASWDETDPTKDAGEYPLSETVGACVDCLPLKDVNIIYKQDSVWGMQYIGGALIFRFYKIFGDWGMPHRDCAIEFLSGRHFVFTGTDLVVHDGNSVRSVANKKVRKMLRRVTSSQLQTCYTTINQEVEEVWFCFRQQVDSYLAADTAIVYNWVDETISVRELRNYRYIQAGRIDPPLAAGTTWNTVTGVWEEKPGIWGQVSLFPAVSRLFAIGTQELVWEDSNALRGLLVLLEREGLGVPARATQAPDMSSMKFLQRVWPRFTGTQGKTVYVTLGTAQGVGEPTRWGERIPFTIGVMKKVDCTFTGRTFAFRIESVDDSPWAFDGLDADVKFVGAN